MATETKKGIGKFFIDSSVTDGEGMRIAKDFLQELLFAFARQSKKYIEHTQEAPFNYSERQIHSMLLPAIATLTDAFLMELPATRKLRASGGNPKVASNGWVDYWCQYRNVDFLIELKHGFDAYRTETTRQTVLTDWKYMVSEQIKSVKADARYLSQFSNGTILLPIHLISVYEYCREGQERQSIENRDELRRIQKNYKTTLKPAPNWSGMWMLNRALTDQCYIELESGYEYYPGVLMVSRVEGLIG